MTDKPTFLSIISTNKIVNNRILLTGPIPPPAGGVSLHILRLAELIEDEFSIDMIDESNQIKEGQFNIRSLDLFQYFKMIKSADLIYIHSGVSTLRILHIISAKVFSRKIILTLHSYRNKKIKINRNIDKLFFNFADVVIVVNKDILSRISLPKEKCIVRGAFIPPKMDKEPHLPDHIQEWITKRKKNGRTLICANAWMLKIFNHEDLYGLDMCIEVTNRLIRNGTYVSFVFIVSSLDENKALFLSYTDLIDKLNLKDDFLLLNEKISFVRLIEMADIVLRPTNTDGDALTVREGIFLGKKVIASDAVTRPLGTIIFKSRDINDLEKKISDLIKSGDKVTANIYSEHENYYKKFYSDLLHKTIEMDK